jgi:hypothetical protein
MRRFAKIYGLRRLGSIKGVLQTCRTRPEIAGSE